MLNQTLGNKFNIYSNNFCLIIIKCWVVNLDSRCLFCAVKQACLLDVKLPYHIFKGWDN